MRVLGLLSGTSADGIDAAICEIDGAPPRVTARVERAMTIAYAPDLRERILRAMRPGGIDAAGMCVLNVEIGEAFAAAALRLLDGESVDLIGSHGQTLWHEPGAFATLQVGEAAVIAERTGMTTISNFRARDMAAGGQGAPLVGFLDWLLLRDDVRWRAVQNIGGIGNVTFLPPLSEQDAPSLAFDTGPGNALIDSAVTILSGGALTYDADGAWAGRGSVDDALLRAWLDHPYYRQAPPKSTGREVFGADMAAALVEQGRGRGLPDETLLATITALTAHSIAEAYAQFAPAPIEEVILGGGGRLNRTLVSLIAGLVAPARVIDSAAAGIDGDHKEALLFALLAYETWHGRPGCLPAQTGARHASVLGQITPGARRA